MTEGKKEEYSQFRRFVEEKLGPTKKGSGREMGPMEAITAFVSNIEEVFHLPLNGKEISNSEIWNVVLEFCEKEGINETLELGDVCVSFIEGDAPSNLRLALFNLPGETVDFYCRYS